jgi:heme/copper-type cytochrome/quinol oxidase subunit 1
MVVSHAIAPVRQARPAPRCLHPIAACYRERVPPLVRRYIKTSLMFLVVGLLLGGYLIVAEFIIGRFPPRLFITAHVHLLLVGFMLMIVMGVATWMFPKAPAESGRYRPGLAEAVYWIMTVSTGLRAVAEIAAPFAASASLRLIIAAAGIGQLVGAGLFVVNMWSRVRMPAGAALPRR